MATALPIKKVSLGANTPSRRVQVLVMQGPAVSVKV